MKSEAAANEVQKQVLDLFRHQSSCRPFYSWNEFLRVVFSVKRCSLDPCLSIVRYYLVFLDSGKQLLAFFIYFLFYVFLHLLYLEIFRLLLFSEVLNELLALNDKFVPPWQRASLELIWWAPQIQEEVVLSPSNRVIEGFNFTERSFFESIRAAFGVFFEYNLLRRFFSYQLVNQKKGLLSRVPPFLFLGRCACLLSRGVYLHKIFLISISYLSYRAFFLIDFCNYFFLYI